MIRQWSFNFPSSSSANARSIPQCSLESTTDLNPIICGQYFRFKTITSYSANELIIALMNKMNPKFNPNITYTDFNTNKYLFCSAVARYLPYGPTDFAQWNIVIGMPNDIYIFDKNHFNLDCKFLGASNEKITCDVLENEKAAIREARALRYIFGNKCDNFNIYVEDTKDFLEGYDELINIRNFEVTWNNSNKSWILNDLSTPPRVVNINWFNIMIGSRILNKPKRIMHIFISKFFHKLLKEKVVKVYTGKRHHLNRRKIYKTINIPSSIVNLPIELHYSIFIKYVKDEKFKGIYTEVFNSMGEDLLCFKGEND